TLRPRSTPVFPYTPLVRSDSQQAAAASVSVAFAPAEGRSSGRRWLMAEADHAPVGSPDSLDLASLPELKLDKRHLANRKIVGLRSEEHTSELQSRENLVCR